MSANKQKRPTESVWDYPRPPRLEDSDRHVLVAVNDTVVAETHRSKRILETSHPPVYYIPPEDVRMDLLQASDRHSYCEWKGIASYYSLAVDGVTVPDAAWYYPNPTAGFVGLRDFVAFYPGKIAALLEGEPVQAEVGSFYGGWITQEITLAR